MIMFCNGGAKILFFPLFPWHCWCCIFRYLFSISTHGRPTCFFLLFAFMGIFQETQKYLSSTPSVPMQCRNGDSTKPDLTRQYSSVQRETQTFPSLFSSGCLAPLWSVRFLSLLLSLQLRLYCDPCQKSCVPDTATFCWIWSQSSLVDTGFC